MENHRTVSLLPTTAPPSVPELQMALRRSAHPKNFLAFSTSLYMRTPSRWCGHYKKLYHCIIKSIPLSSILTSSTLVKTLKLFQGD